MARKKKKVKRFRAVTAVKEMARERVGEPPAGQIVVEKKKKPEKHKPTLGKLLSEPEWRKRQILTGQLNAAATVVLFCKKTVQLAPLAVLQPCHVWKLLAGVAVRVTAVPIVNWKLQMDPALQLIPTGELKTFPLVPVTVTVRVGCAPAGVHPEAAGPFTVTGTELLTTSLGLSWKVA
jgi:hypothetical protein